jgi:hypothetical protein
MGRINVCLVDEKSPSAWELAIRRSNPTADTASFLMQQSIAALR